MKIVKRCFQIALFLLLCVGVSNITEAKSREEIEKDIIKFDKWIKYWNDQIPRIKSKEKILIPAPTRYWKGKSNKDVMDFRERNWPKIEIYDNTPYRTYDFGDYVRRFKQRYGKGEEAKRELMKIVDRSERMAIDIKIIRIPNTERILKENKDLLASTSTQNMQKDPKNTIYIADANPQYIINAKSYAVYFESKSGANTWIKSAASANDLIILFPIWTRELMEGDKVKKIVANLHEGGTKTYNDVFVKKR